MDCVELHRSRRRRMRRHAVCCRVVEGRSTPFGGRWRVAKTPWKRFRGLSCRRPDDTVMVFPRCRDIHTLTMRHPLDVAFLDCGGRIIEVRRLVLPGARLVNEGAFSVIERFAQSGSWFMQGDRCELRATASSMEAIRQTRVLLSGRKQ